MSSNHCLLEREGLGTRHASLHKSSRFSSPILTDLYWEGLYHYKARRLAIVIKCKSLRALPILSVVLSQHLSAFQHCTRKMREPGKTYHVRDVRWNQLGTRLISLPCNGQPSTRNGAIEGCMLSNRRLS